MAYYSFSGVLWLHFLLGGGLTVAYALYCHNKQHERHLFVFGGDALSVGQSAAWLRWYLAAYIFELLTSFLPGVGPLYQEMALSLFEAAAFTVGTFVVDRLMLVFEAEMATSEMVGPRVSDRIYTWWRGRQEPKSGEAKEAAGKFDDLTKGH